MNKWHKGSEEKPEQPIGNSSPDSDSSSESTETASEQVTRPVEVLPSESTSSSTSEEISSEEGGGTRIVSVSYGEATFHRGPLPPPETLRQYDEILPGSADRIMKTAEANMAHRREERKRGQYGGIAIACLAIVGGCIIAIFSNTWYVAFAGVLIATIGVGGSTAAQAFVERFPKISKEKPSKENEED